MAISCLAMQPELQQKDGLLLALDSHQESSQIILSHLNIRDILALRLTCDDLRGLWDFSRTITITDLNIKRILKFLEMKDAKNPIKFVMVGRDQAVLDTALTKLSDYAHSAQEIRLGKCDLTALPAQLQQFANLEILRLNGNLLTNKDISQIGSWFPQLEELDLSHNLINQVTRGIIDLPRLKKLFFHGIKFRSEYIEYLKTTRPQVHFYCYT